MNREDPNVDKQKFKEVILYILNRIGPLDEPTLLSLLYFIDFDYYEKYEEFMVGATFVKR
jgi:hypothetical protein